MKELILMTRRSLFVFTKNDNPCCDAAPAEGCVEVGITFIHKQRKYNPTVIFLIEQKKHIRTPFELKIYMFQTMRKRNQTQQILNSQSQT